MRRLDAMAQQIDIAPTLVELTGARSPAAFQGRSLVALMRGAVTTIHDALIVGAGREWHPVAVRTDRWKLIQHQEKPTELYDLSADPSETTNVYEQFPEEARALEQRLDAWRRETPERVGVEPEERVPGEVQEVLRNAGYLSEEVDGL
jgi:arylsulfatase